MGPRELQQKIHSTFSTGEAAWSSFKSEIITLYNNTSNYADFNDHLLREFNRKVLGLGFDGLVFSPYDGGYRFIGSSLGGVPDSGFVFLYNNLDEQVVTNSEDNIQIPEEFANS